jgi:hypothetical protein
MKITYFIKRVYKNIFQKTNVKNFIVLKLIIIIYDLILSF